MRTFLCVPSRNLSPDNPNDAVTIEERHPCCGPKESQPNMRLIGWVLVPQVLQSENMRQSHNLYGHQGTQKSVGRSFCGYRGLVYVNVPLKQLPTALCVNKPNFLIGKTTLLWKPSNPANSMNWFDWSSIRLWITFCMYSRCCVFWHPFLFCRNRSVFWWYSLTQ